MTARKRILFVTPRIPFPPSRGDTIRTFHQLQHLARRHDVFLATFCDRTDDARCLNTLRSLCSAVFAVPASRTTLLMKAAVAGLRGESAMVGAYRHSELHRKVAAWSADCEFDVASGFSAVTAPFVLAAQAKRRVLDLCDADSQKWADYAERSRWPVSSFFRLEARRLGAFERDCIRKFDALFVVCDRERRIVDPHDRYPRICVIGNGTNLDFAPPPRAASCGPLIGFVGRLDYRPNIEGVHWFLTRVWPLVKSRQKGARLYLVGANPDRSIRRLSRHDGVIVAANVSDPREYLARCRIAIAPLLTARGLQNKVLEAMALARPLVVTSAVAEGLHCRDLCVADEPAGFAQAIISLCENDAQCTILARRGRRCAEQNYAWPNVLAEYEATLLGVASFMRATVKSRSRALVAGSVLQPSRSRSRFPVHARGPHGESLWPEGSTLDRIPRGLPVEEEAVR